MTSDEKARAMDALVEDYREARGRRESLTDPLASPRRGSKGPVALAARLMAKEGQKKIKEVMSALKAERNALKALKKFAAKQGKQAEAATRDRAKAEAAGPKIENSKAEPLVSLTEVSPRPGRTAKPTERRAAVARSPRPGTA
jgi:hypothetical protein